MRRKNRLLDNEELLRLEELNRAANSAKHEGLGVDEVGVGGELESEDKKDRLVEEKDMEGAGDCIGDLERSYAKLLGGALRKTSRGTATSLGPPTWETLWQSFV